MNPAPADKLFKEDRLSKRERVMRTLNHQPVDRVAIHDQLSFNPRVISHYSGKHFDGFTFSVEDICAAIRQTLDICFPPVAPKGKDRITTEDGFVIQHDEWTHWVLQRPFQDEHGARDWLIGRTKELRDRRFDPDAARARYRSRILGIQQMIGDTVIFDYPAATGLCSVYSDQGMGLEIFAYFYDAYPEVFQDYMEAFVAWELRKLHAIADASLSPVVLIAEDFSTKQGPLFPPEFLARHHYPHVKALADGWRSHGYKVLYHSDGNYKKTIPALIGCGVDGFYCLEPNCGMDIVALKKEWPQMVWAGGVDGVDLLERGSPAQVRAEVHRHIRESNVLSEGGMFLASSSEINPPIPLENFRAMVEAAGELRNPEV